MTTFIVKGSNSRPYLYAKCTCGKATCISDQVLKQFAAVKHTYRISENIKRGLLAARELDKMYKSMKDFEDERR